MLRPLLIAACFLLLFFGIAIGTLFPLPTIAGMHLANVITLAESGFSSKDFSIRVVTEILALAFVGLLGSQYRLIVGLLRHAIEVTDEQIIGRWYVYRYGQKHHIQYWIKGEWNITRSRLRGTYKVAQTRHNSGVRIDGEVVYKERDRLNILLTGINHKQQSLVSFQTTIPSNYDRRMLGVGVGDDADYFLGSRVYLASRVSLSDELARAIIDDATGALRACGNGLLQLPMTKIAEIFSRYPVPESEMQSGEDEQSSGWTIWLARTTAWARKPKPSVG